MNHFINTAATDLSRARTTGLNQLTPEPFPVLVVGTRTTHKFFFADRGTLESWSGQANYSLRVTVGDAYSPPVGSTFELTVASEDPLNIAYDVDQAGLQNVLNDSAGVTADGGVDVLSQGIGRFLIAYRAAGLPASAIVADGALLNPDSTADLLTLRTGDSTHRQLMMLTLSRTVPVQVETWTPILSPYAGWSGDIPLTSSATIQLLRLNGVQHGPYIQCTTLITVEVLDASQYPTAYFQAPLILRAINETLSTVPVDTTTLPVGPTDAEQTIAAPGSLTVTPTSQIHTASVSVTGIAGAYNLLVQSTGLVAGARIDLIVLFDVADAVQIALSIYTTSTGGELLFQFTRVHEQNALFVLYANGSGGFKRVSATVPAFAS